MIPSTATTCARCGTMLPRGGDACPACGQPADPDATWYPPPVTPPGRGMADSPLRLPLGLLAVLATACALMGMTVGVWLGMRRELPTRQTRTELPALPPPGPAAKTLPPSSTYYPVPPAPAPAAALPPARVSPPMVPGQSVDRRPQFRGDWRNLPGPARFPSERQPAPAVRPPLRARGMATVRVRNPSPSAVEIVFSGDQAQKGIVGPRASVDLLIPPGRYDITLNGAARAQRFYDAPLAEGDVLDLVYHERLGAEERTATGD